MLPESKTFALYDFKVLRMMENHADNRKSRIEGMNFIFHSLIFFRLKKLLRKTRAVKIINFGYPFLQALSAVYGSINYKISAF